jgi:rare lipoprotein A (peptidoglycan hydrolase)
MRRYWHAAIAWSSIFLLAVMDVSAGGWSTAVASWYGGSDGLLGNGTACGQTLTTSLMGVAHKSLPCGTRVTFRHAGHTLTVPVVDRGPFVAGRTWDLTVATCRALEHCFTGPIQYQVGGGNAPAHVTAPRVPSRGTVLPATDSE